jgi:hypothetical protein
VDDTHGARLPRRRLGRSKSVVPGLLLGGVGTGGIQAAISVAPNHLYPVRSDPGDALAFLQRPQRTAFERQHPKALGRPLCDLGLLKTLGYTRQHRLSFAIHGYIGDITSCNRMYRSRADATLVVCALARKKSPDHLSPVSGGGTPNGVPGGRPMYRNWRAKAWKCLRSSSSRSFQGHNRHRPKRSAAGAGETGRP